MSLSVTSMPVNRQTTRYAVCVVQCFFLSFPSLIFFSWNENTYACDALTLSMSLHGTRHATRYAVCVAFTRVALCSRFRFFCFLNMWSKTRRHERRIMSAELANRRPFPVVVKHSEPSGRANLACRGPQHGPRLFVTDGHDGENYKRPTGG